MTSRAWARALVIAYVAVVVGSVSTLVVVLAVGTTGTPAAARAGRASVAATLRPVSRAAHRFTGADRTALAPLEDVARSLGSAADTHEALALTAASSGVATGAKQVVLTPAG